jgi:hypothetical protein
MLAGCFRKIPADQGKHPGRSATTSHLIVEMFCWSVTLEAPGCADTAGLLQKRRFRGFVVAVARQRQTAGRRSA